MTEEVFDPMPTEDDFTSGAPDASGEIYDQFDRRGYEYALKKWKERNNVKEEVSWDEAWKKYCNGWHSESTYVSWLNNNYTLIPKNQTKNQQ
jgi:hypothetical protein